MDIQILFDGEYVVPHYIDVEYVILYEKIIKSKPYHEFYKTLRDLIYSGF